VNERERLRAAANDLNLWIAIDGPAGAGKSTVGRDVSVALDCSYLDTGLMYRAITWLALREGISLTDAPGLAELGERTRFALMPEESGTLLVDGSPLGDLLSSPSVEAKVSAVSAQPDVRSALVRSQREFAEGRCIVMIGRDIGTVVLPDAPVKLWVTASPQERARRRLAEREGIGLSVSETDLAAELQERDERDATRPVSPSVPAPDAITLDTDQLTPREAACEALKVVESTIEKLPDAV
jgi:cytidylate kinase